MGVNIFNDSIIGCKIGTDTIDAIYQGTELLYSSVPPVFQGKWLATYSDNHTESAECDASSAISSNEVSTTNLVELKIGSCVRSIGSNAFSACTSLTSIVIPDSVTSIGSGAFTYCSGLTSLTIPESITIIGAYTFAGGTNLASITVEAVTPPNLGTNAFIDTNDCPIYVPSASVSAYQTAWPQYASRIQAIP